VSQVPAVGNAPGQLTVAGRVDSDLRKTSLVPSHQSEVGSLGEREGGGVNGARVLHRCEEVGEPRVLLDRAREERCDAVSSVHQGIQQIVGGDVNVANGNIGSGLNDSSHLSRVSKLGFLNEICN